MGLSLAGASSNTNSSSTGTTANTYSPGQTAVQNLAGTTLSNNLAAANSGTLTPGNTAALTSANDATNKTSAGLTDRITQFLAARGFGKSGQTGEAALQGELGRESQIGSNTAAAQANQGNQNQGNLLAALNYAFTSLGATGASTGTSSGTAFGAGASLAVPGVH